MSTRQNRYLARERGSSVDLHCRGRTIEEAAEHVARRLHGQRAVARRTTGEPGLSGYFRAYVYDRRLNGLNSVGRPYHMREA